MEETVIKINQLSKYFDGRCVLDNINLTVPKGCIYGLLGRNGVGKTTLIRLLLGLDLPTRGASSIFNTPSDRLTPAVKARTGYVAEGHNLIQNYRVTRLIALCKDLSRNWNREVFEALIKKFNLPTDRKVKQLSTGMRAQLNLSLAMATEPELLILDDPTLGLDTVARRHFLELAIEVIQKQGRTILFSSHILSDVERIADRIGILVDGRLLVDCDLETLKTRIKKFRVIFPEQAPAELHIKELIGTRTAGREMTITAANWNERKHAMLEVFAPESIDEIPMTLEDIFIECTDGETETAPAI